MERIRLKIGDYVTIKIAYPAISRRGVIKEMNDSGTISLVELEAFTEGGCTELGWFFTSGLNLLPKNGWKD